jgi:hypothetical protein
MLLSDEMRIVLRKAIAFFMLFFSFLSVGSADSWDSEQLLYVCNEKLSSVRLSLFSEDAEVLFAKASERDLYTERINTANLRKYSPTDKEGNVTRTGSETLERKCGIFRIKIKSGFLNANPYGDLGAVNFPLVEISVNEKSKPTEISIGLCDENVKIYNNSTQCPSNWATDVKGYIAYKKPRIILTHTDVEYRSLP